MALLLVDAGNRAVAVVTSILVGSNAEEILAYRWMKGHRLVHSSSDLTTCNVNDIPRTYGIPNLVQSTPW